MLSMTHPLAMPRPCSLSSSRSSFSGLGRSFKALSISSAPPQPSRRPPVVPVEMKRVCDLTGKKRNNGFSISFSHRRSKKIQYPNLQSRKIYWPAGQRSVKLKISTKALRTIEKIGLEKMAKRAGIDLWKLPFEDCRPERIAYLKEHPMQVPTKKNPRNKKMKNPERLAASKKKPMVPIYFEGHVIHIREGTDPDVLPVLPTNF